MRQRKTADPNAPKLTAEEKEKARQSRLYFNADTQAAIVAYQQAKEDKKTREKLYVTRIMPAFEKLVENLINIHKFSSLFDNYDDLKNDCVNFLFETIGKFDPTRGTNAFSYYNVVAKNWLIIRTKQKSQRVRRTISLDDPEALTTAEMHTIEEHCTVPGQDVQLEQRMTAQNIVMMLYEVRNLVKSENELTTINSIVTVFENINEVDFLSKAAVMLYIRELSGLSPKQLTTALQSIKRLYRQVKDDNVLDELF